MQAGRRRRKRAPIMAPGGRLDADLTVVDHLGGSRKVDIYLCRSKQRQGLVACKVLRPEYRIDFSALEAVLREGELLTRLRHPNVVEGHAVELEPHPRIVMQHLPGQTLSTALFEGNYGAFRLVDFTNIAAQIADALTYLHGQGLLHLDVKPSNIMYHDGHATLFDLSVAREFDPARPRRDNAGTREYMAPEQTNREHVGYATDVFGLGVVFYRLLTGGELPYPTVDRPNPDEEGATVRQLDYGTPPRPPAQFNPAVLDGVSAVVLRALEPSPEDRFATPAQFKEALARTNPPATGEAPR